MKKLIIASLLVTALSSCMNYDKQEKIATADKCKCTESATMGNNCKLPFELAKGIDDLRREKEEKENTEFYAEYIDCTDN